MPKKEDQGLKNLIEYCRLRQEQETAGGSNYYTTASVAAICILNYIIIQAVHVLSLALLL